MTERERLSPDDAERFRKKGKNSKAGRCYALRSFEKLIESEFEPRYRVLGSVIDLIRSAICYRLGGENEACKARSYQGVSIIQDANEIIYRNENEERLLQAVMMEITGDFYVISGIGSYEDEYKSAHKIYDDFQSKTSDNWNIIDQAMRDEFEVSIGVFFNVAEAVGHQFDNAEDIRTHSLTARTSAKLDKYSELLEELEKEGRWVWEG
jgi:GGDEF domain-containing protein